MVDVLFKQGCVYILWMHRFSILSVEVVLDAIGLPGRFFLYQILNQGSTVGKYKIGFDMGPHGVPADFDVAGIQQFSLDPALSILELSR